MDLTSLWMQFENFVRRLFRMKSTEEAGLSPRSLKLELTPTAYNQLRSLKVKTNAESIPVVVKEALSFYDYLVSKVKGQGYKVYLIKGEEMIELKMPPR